MRNIKVYSAFVVTILYVYPGCIFVCGALTVPKAIGKFDSQDNIGVNIIDKKGIPYIDGIGARKIRFSSEESDVELSNFEKVFNKNTLTGRNLDGVCCSVKIKNKTRINHKIALNMTRNDQDVFLP